MIADDFSAIAARLRELREPAKQRTTFGIVISIEDMRSIETRTLSPDEVSRGFRLDPTKIADAVAAATRGWRRDE